MLLIFGLVLTALVMFDEVTTAFLLFQQERV